MGSQGLKREIYQDEFPAGVTEYSKEQFLKYRGELGRIIKVVIMEISDEFSTYIHGSEAILVLDGFSFGYRGEGPHGLIWLLEQCGMEFEIQTIFGGMRKLEFYPKTGE